MPIVRMYSGDDGQTHVEEMDVELNPDLTALQAAEGIVFRKSEPGHFTDWHHAPRRQWVITLSGEVEIGLGDGSVRRYGPGHATLAEDLTGQGHTTRVVGSEARVTATIPLSDCSTDYVN